MAELSKTKIILRNGTAAQWTQSNPILLAGEAGVESDTSKIKYGDGVTAWTDLQYAVGSQAETPASWGEITGTLSNQTDLQNILDSKENTAQKGAANGYAPLDEDGLVPSVHVPVDTSKIDAHIAQTSEAHAIPSQINTAVTTHNEDPVAHGLSAGIVSALGAADSPSESNPYITKNTAAGAYAPLGTDGKVPAANLPDPPDLSPYQPKSEKGAANGYAPLGADSKVPSANLPDPPDLSPYQPKSEKGKASGYAPLDANGQVPSANLPAGPIKRQFDLAIPGNFAAETTSTALLSVGHDYASWQMEPARIRRVLVRCFAADSGASPAAVCLYVNGQQAGETAQVLSSSWSMIILSGTGKAVNTGDDLEIGITATGTNGDSEDLRVVLVAEVS